MKIGESKEFSHTRGTLVLAGLDIFMRGRCRDRAHMSGFPGGTFLTEIADEAERRGFLVVTLDQFLAGNKWPAPALLVSDMGVGLRECVGRAIPAVCWCLESPIVANRFFHRLEKNTAPFRHLFVWSGAFARVPAGTGFHPMLWPNEFRGTVKDQPWGARRFAVMVTANKVPFRLVWPAPSYQPWRLVRWLGAMLLNAPATAWIRGTDPWMRENLSGARREAVVCFGGGFDFDLFGCGWEAALRSDNAPLAAAVKRCYRGPIPPGVAAKVETVAGYRFCLCFENTRFPGYVTEKIFDALFAGSIPVYLGAPDISHHVWPECFVDASRFSSPADLAAFLGGLSETDTHQLRERGRAFLASKDFDRFCAEHTARLVVDALEDKPDAAI